MDNTFKRSVSLKLEKKSGLAHLSIRTSEYKVEVFKLNISDIGSILMQFSDAMRDQEWEEIIINPINEEINENNENIENDDASGSGN
jgi:hypothetical protein